MQVFTNPGSTTYPSDDKGRTVNELRIELAAPRGPGQPETTEYGVVLHVNEYRGSLLVTVTYGDPDWRPAVDLRTNRRPQLPTLVLGAVEIPRA